jgi:hypothetical protein
MRLTIAATLLTQAIPAAYSSSSPSNTVAGGGLLKNNKMRHLMHAMKQRLGKVPAIERSLLHEDPSIQNSNLRVNKPQEVLGGAPLLKNSKRVECDPSSQDELDVGILSCGSVGQHSCKESKESSLGGFCVIEAEGASSVSRVLQENGLCDPSMDPDYDINCDCDGYDSDTMTGTITCIPYDRCCVEAEANSFCATVTFDVTLEDGLPTELVECYAFTFPYVRTACYSTFYDEARDATCEHTIDGEACVSCRLEPSSEDPDETCNTFDCTNTIVDEAQLGTTCNNEYPLPVLDFLNSDEIDKFPITCFGDLKPTLPKFSKSSKKGKKSGKKGKKSNGKKSRGKKAMRLV